MTTPRRKMKIVIVGIADSVLPDNKPHNMVKARLAQLAVDLRVLIEQNSSVEEANDFDEKFAPNSNQANVTLSGITVTSVMADQPNEQDHAALKNCDFIVLNFNDTPDASNERAQFDLEKTVFQQFFALMPGAISPDKLPMLIASCDPKCGLSDNSCTLNYQDASQICRGADVSIATTTFVTHDKLAMKLSIFQLERQKIIESKVATFRKIYAIMRESETSWYQRFKTNFLTKLPVDASDAIDVILDYVTAPANKDSRTKAAWDLVNKYHDKLIGSDGNPDPDLVKELYLHSFKNSGWLSLSKATGSTFFSSAALQHQIKDAKLEIDEKSDTRAAMIYRGLKQQ